MSPLRALVSPVRLLLAMALTASAAIAQDKPSASAPTERATSAPRHACKAPSIPGEINDQPTADRVRRDVDGYRECIQSFATAQQELAEQHNKAANDAIGEYNRFVAAKLPSK